MKQSIVFVAILLAVLSVSAQKKVKIEKPETPVKMKVAPYVVKVVPNPDHFISRQRDTTITIRLTRSKFNYFKQNRIDLAVKASELLENYDVPILLDIKPDPLPDSTPITPTNEQPKVIAQHILEDGGFETEYEDGSKRINYKSGYTMIFPDGRQMQASYMTVSPFIPPTPPEDNDQMNYLQNVSAELLSLLSEFLDNDTVSITNFRKGEADLNIYEVINRRMDFLNYINLKQ